MGHSFRAHCLGYTEHHKQGDSIKSIASNLGISKNTVKACISKLTAGEIPFRRKDLSSMTNIEIIFVIFDIWSR